MSTSVYDKTDKGREEIATRKYHLPPRLRTLLVMIDGKRTIDLLMNDLSKMGLSEESFNQLLVEDYIRLVGGAAAAGSAAATAIAAAAAVPVAPAPVAAAPAPVQPPPAPVVQRAHEAPEMTEGERFRALYDFYNQTIKSIIGLRGFGLQLKVEKCSNTEDFRALRETYLEAVQKAKGSETAMGMRDRLDQLLGGAPDYDPFKPD